MLNFKWWLSGKKRRAHAQVEEEIVAKWEQDLDYVHLTAAHRDLYFEIHRCHKKALGSYPSIVAPKSYNECIAWLMLFDQRPELPACMDKYAVRRIVEEQIGAEHLTELYGCYDSFDAIPFDQLPRSFVIKATHDSGSVFLIRDKEKLQRRKIKKSINKSLARIYGARKGEWAYKHIVPRIIIEEYLGDTSEPPPPDYKFHCADGRVRWLQYIFDRGTNTKEATYSREFESLDLHLDRDFAFTPSPVERPANWTRLVEVAERLARGFKYVRVDLYDINGRVVFGELTFFPRAGCYITDDNVKFGGLLDIDTSTALPPVQADVAHA